MNTNHRPTEHERHLRAAFDHAASRHLETLGATGDIDVVAGIVCRLHAAPGRGVVAAVRDGLERAGLGGRVALVGLGASPEGDEVDDVRLLDLADELDAPGWRYRLLLHLAVRAGAAMLVVPDDRDAPPPQSIARMVEAVRSGRYGLAAGVAGTHPLTDPVDAVLSRALLSGVFRHHLHHPSSGVVALSYDFARECQSLGAEWGEHAEDRAVGAWTSALAVSRGYDVCEVPLEHVPHADDALGLKMSFRETARALFAQAVALEDDWCDGGVGVRRASWDGPRVDTPQNVPHFDTSQLMRQFRLEYDHYSDTLFPEILPEPVRARLGDGGDAALDADGWLETLHAFLLAYRFDHRFAREDVVDALFPIFLARLVTVQKLGRELEEKLVGTSLDAREAAALAGSAVERELATQDERAASRFDGLRERWRELDRASEPYLPRLGAWEFVPSVGVIVPQELEVDDGHSVWAYQVYKELIDGYRVQYTDFVAAHLGVADETDGPAVLSAFENHLLQLETALETGALGGLPATRDGLDRMVRRVLDAFDAPDCFRLTEEAAAEVLRLAPPSHLITRLECGDTHALLERMSALDALALTAWTDQHYYLTRVLGVLRKHATISWFESAPATVQIVDRDEFPDLPEQSGATALARLAGRVSIATAPPRSGGDYPVLWTLLRFLKRHIGVELFSEVWKRFASDRVDFADRLIASIQGHWGRLVLSAHNAFENRHQRILRDRLVALAESLSRDEGTADAGRLLQSVAGVYHVSITLPDATFVPLSAWTWASHSNRGGVGAPTPLSSLVERDWATRDFFTLYVERAGIANAERIDEKIVELMGEGRESEDLRTHILGITTDPDRLVAGFTPEARPAPARELQRPLDTPMISPTEREWESRYVLNAAAMRLDGTVYVLYRAFGTDEISRIGLAWSKDGIHADGRLEEPIFVPETPEEIAGVEDPRTVVIDGRVYMLYTAWDRKVAQIAMASITVEDFLAHRWDRWKRHGMAYPGLANKDAVLFPERIDGKFAVYHRIDPNMWVSYIDELECPWPREDQTIFAGPRAGMMWDGVKIGAGGPPIKTRKGWLNIYHGVDYERSYRLGSMMMALDDPSRITYRSPNPILEPRTDYELGDAGSWVPHVVFTCGAVPVEEKDILDADDEILVYYGAADTVIGVARGTVRDMVPVYDEL